MRNRMMIRWLGGLIPLVASLLTGAAAFCVSAANLFVSMSGTWTAGGLTNLREKQIGTDRLPIGGWLFSPPIRYSADRGERLG